MAEKWFNMDIQSSRVIESPYAKAGQALIADGAVFLHPLDLLRISRPDLSPVERVMVLVDRIVNAALHKLDGEMEVDW